MLTSTLLALALFVNPGVAAEGPGTQAQATPQAQAASAPAATSSAPSDAAKALAAEATTPRDLTQYALRAGSPALGGHDPVGFYVENRAVRGEERFAETYRGVTYWFASEANREIFRQSPAAFEPVFGGWCAAGMAEGKKVQANPENFRIHHGRLFVFARGLFSNAARGFDRDPDAMTTRGVRQWKRLSGEDTRAFDASHSEPGHSCPLCSSHEGEPAEKGVPADSRAEPARKP
jgi:YHS domain-containing protein